jgi:hypothetical protein
MFIDHHMKTKNDQLTLLAEEVTVAPSGLIFEPTVIEF